MSTELALKQNHDINMWHDDKLLKEIRLQVSQAPLSDVEFSALVNLGRATNLNPFLKEIWAVKFKDRSAQIFIGRDGYRKAAQRQRDYDYHQVNAIYSNDEFTISDGLIHHTHGFMNRGTLVGAYCIVKRKSSEKYIYSLVKLDEYNLKQSLWNSKPETMIKKVAEAQALRHAFQEVFAGTYSDSELPEEKTQLRVINPEGTTQTEKLNNLLQCQKPQTMQNFGDKSQPASVEQVEIIYNLIELTNYSQDKLNKALAHYDLETIEQLSDYQAQRFIYHLEKLKND